VKVFAIIPAAGSGRRFGAIKQFQELAGKPVLLHTLEAFEACSAIEGMILAVPATDIPFVRSLTQNHSLKKVIHIIEGGKERQDSVKKAFDYTPPCDVIAIHDGVRPLITQELIERVVKAAGEFGAAIPGLPAKETTKRVTPDLFVSETLDRSSLWCIQTPQAFSYNLFRQAVEKAQKETFVGTDESMLVERLGAKVKIIEGDSYNIKVTTPEDLKIAESLLKLRQ
jgi:2-C-methyl-D-erythritol 4-phosphate cytidylyltransferase